MSLEENKQLVADFFNAMKVADLETLDKITTDDFAFRPMIGEGGLKKEAMLKMIGSVLDAFSEHTNRIDDIVAEGDRVAVRMTVTGVHTGQWGKHAPTGKAFEIAECFFLRIENGKIAEYMGIKDALGQYQQLGILPPNDEIG
jgi:steroid delta-isomerase-like uncharacterized protein